MVTVAKNNSLRRQAVQKLKLAWPEKFAIVAILFIATSAFVFWSVLATIVGSAHNDRINAAVFHLYINCEFVFVTPLWMILRSVYFISNGWQRWHSQ